MKRSIAKKILLCTLLVVVAMAAGIMAVMTVSMNSLTDTIMLNVMQPMAKTAAQSVEANLHVLADRFFLIRDNEVLASPDSPLEDKTAILAHAESGIEFVWLGLYDEKGLLMTGGEACPGNISSRALFNMMAETGALAIEDTSAGADGGLQVLMGVPINAAIEARTDSGTDTDADTDSDPDTDAVEVYYLVGSYEYDVLGDVLGNINIGSNGTALIVNSEGGLNAHKSSDRVLERESALEALGGSGEAVATLVMMLQGQTGSAVLEGPDGRMYISFAPVHGTTWSIGILSPRSDFLGPVQRALTLSTALALAFLAFFSILLVLLIRRTLTVPMRDITENATALSEGRFDALLPHEYTERNDEIGDLSAAFTGMSDAIHSVIRDIDTLTSGAAAGMLLERIDESRHSGDFERISSGINATMDVVCTHLDYMPNAVALFDRDAQLLYTNRELREIFDLGRHSGEDAAERLFSGISDKERISIAALFASPTTDEILRFNKRILAPDGEERIYSAIMRRTDSPESVSVMLVLSDITPLVRAMRDAEQASEAKTSFLANMSHEMRTPMNAIIGMTSIAKGSADIERKDYCLSKIEDASNHLLGVINDILDMSKIEAQKFELSTVSFNFEKMLQRVANVISFRVDERSQTFTVYIDSRIPAELIGDDQRLSQVITNLLSNAVKFTPENGRIRLDATLEAEQNGICTIRVDVRDTGIGISEEQRQRLFRSFEQADSSTSRKYGGTGLGLVISKRIVEMMDGKIWVESEPGSGSVFSFTAELRRGESAATPRRPLISRADLRILAVDDAPEILEFFTEIAGQLKVNCDTAASGAEALEKIRETGGYDICFVDWRMPEMDGITLARRIKEEDKNPVVIMISGVEWSEIEQEARAAGVDKFLAKPLFVSHISDCINECLGAEMSVIAPQEPLPDDRFEGRRLLLVEDVEINREIVLSLLEPTGIEIECAENGLRAVELFESREPYDLIFMDVQMPEMDGYEATRKIREIEAAQGGRVPIIAMTANVFREDIEKCIASGMDGHVGKPLDFAEVLRSLRHYLSR